MTEYINKGSDHLRGKTWDFYPRFGFAGTEIPTDKAGKLEIMMNAGREYKEKNPDATPEECAAWGKRFLAKERKYYRVYLKGKNSYIYGKGIYLVEDESRLERFKRFAQEFEEKYAAEQLAKETETTEVNG